MDDDEAACFKEVVRCTRVICLWNQDNCILSKMKDERLTGEKAGTVKGNLNEYEKLYYDIGFTGYVVDVWLSTCRAGGL